METLSNIAVIIIVCTALGYMLRSFMPAQRTPNTGNGCGTGGSCSTCGACARISEALKV